MTTPFAELAERPEVLLVILIWAILEATVLPIVPDVLIGLLVMSAPWRLVPMLTAAIVGGLLGGLGWWRLLLWRPRTAARILALQPGLGARGLRDAGDRLAQKGEVRGFGQIGPGIPLKAYLAALADRGPATPWGRVALLIALNRVTRIGSVVLGFALAAPLAARLDGPPLILGAVYVVGWTVFYLLYWRHRSRG